MRETFAHLPAALLPWYEKNARDLPWRRDREPYHVWLSEIMLQQTRVETVKGYYARFLAALPTIAALAAAEEELLLKLWEGLGYYSRARNLQKTARQIMAVHGGVFPRDYAAIRALPGIGDYTAGAIASICFGARTPAVDGNVLRVAARLTELPESVSRPAVKKEISAALADIYPVGRCGEFTQALMELGATVCTPGRPACAACPADSFCAANAHGTQSRYPILEKKPPRRVEALTVFLLYGPGGELALRKRGESGLLAGLWELPNVPGALTDTQAVEQAAAWGLEPEEMLFSQGKKHIFTHVEWHMTGYSLRCRRLGADFVWAGPEELETKYALPTAFKKFL